MKDRRQRQSQQQIKDTEKHQSTAGEREEIRVTESSTKKNTQVTNRGQTFRTESKCETVADAK